MPKTAPPAAAPGAADVKPRTNRDDGDGATSGAVDPALQTPDERRKGLMALLMVVVLWVASAELMQYLFEGGGGYDRPVFVTMTACASFVIYGGLVLSDQARYTQFVTIDAPGYHFQAGAFCLLWVVANLAFNASLERTSAASATALASSSTIFALIGGAATGVEVMTGRKTLAVMLCFTGCVITALSDGKSDASNDAGAARATVSMQGDALALTSAALYAGYLLLFQSAIGNRIDTPHFLTMVGCWGIVLWPLTAFIEPIKSPTALQMFFVVINGVIGTAISERLWLYGALRCGPTTASIALVLTIPLAAVVDLARGRLEMKGPEWLVGATLIVAGFALINK